MHAISHLPTGGLHSLARWLLVAVGVFACGGVLASPVAATPIPANGASIADRVQAQKELCMVEEGDFSQRTTSGGFVFTTCKGGKSEGRNCMNTTLYTDCYKPFTRPPDNTPTSPTNGQNGFLAAGRARSAHHRRHREPTYHPAAHRGQGYGDSKSTARAGGSR